MPRLKPTELPAHCHHRASNRGFVKIPGEPRPTYTGPWGSEEAERTYWQEINRWLGRGRRPRPRIASGGLTVGNLADQYLEHARGYYVKQGEPTGSLSRIVKVVADLKRLCGSVQTADFGLDEFEALRGLWVGRKLTRGTVNGYGQHVKAIFRWGLPKKLVPIEVCHLLREVGGLPKGRSAARDNPRVSPAPPESVKAVLEYLDRRNRDMADLLRLIEASRMRPGEARIMRACDVDRTETPWVYTPTRHKTEHLVSLPKRIPLGPRARAIVGPRIDAAFAAGRPTDYLFPSPAPARGRRGKRGSFVPKGKSRAERSVPSRRGDRCYQVSSLSQVTREVCRRLGVPTFHPHALRHSGAVAVRRQFGLEGVQAALGHSNAETSEIYSRLTYEDAAKIAEATG